MSVLSKIVDGLVWPGVIWRDFKLYLEHAAVFSHDSLHVLAGVVLQLVFAGLLRTSIASARPWLLVLALELLNELNDFRAEGWTFLEVQWIAAGKDLFLTMILPAILLLAARHLPSLFRQPAKATAHSDAGQTPPANPEIDPAS